MGRRGYPPEFRGRQSSLPHPRDGRPADFLFVAAGRRLCDRRIRQGLRDAAAAAGLAATDGSPLAPYGNVNLIWPHCDGLIWPHPAVGRHAG
jgi:hypothetical protein